MWAFIGTVLWITVKIGIPVFLAVLALLYIPAIIIGILSNIILLPIHLSKFVWHIAARIVKSRRSKDAFSHKQDSYNNHQQRKGSEEQASFNQGETYKQESTDPSSSWYDMLGVKKGASKAELKEAFKSKMQMNHPDKLATLDPELQKVASDRTIAIKDAYEKLIAAAA